MLVIHALDPRSLLLTLCHDERHPLLDTFRDDYATSVSAQRLVLLEQDLDRL